MAWIRLRFGNSGAREVSLIDRKNRAVAQLAVQHPFHGITGAGHVVAAPVLQGKPLNPEALNLKH